MNTERTQEKIGLRIKHRRVELGLTQEELATRLGNKSRASVCTVENGKEDLTTTRIKQYADALQCTPSFLMGWTDNPCEIRLAEESDFDKKVRMEEQMESYIHKLYSAYRDASPDTQAAVRAILHIEEE